MKINSRTIKNLMCTTDCFSIAVLTQGRKKKLNRF